MNQTLVAATLRSRESEAGISRPGRGGEDDFNLVLAPEVAAPLCARDAKGPAPDRSTGTVVQTVKPVSGGPDASHAQAGHLVPTLRSNPRNNSNPVTEAKMLVWTDRRQSDELRVYEDGVAPAVSRHAGTGGGNALNVGVRRLTPREYERLQGFPDDWSRYGVDDEGTEIELSDSARYRLVGNAVTVPVVEWIARRLAAIAAADASTG